MWTLDRKVGSSERLRPGDIAERGGLYMVTHSGHRLSHFAIVNVGNALPRCNQCGDSVRYSLYREASYIENDSQFSSVRTSRKSERRVA